MSSSASVPGHAFRGSFVWSCPEKSLSIHLALDVMRRMRPPLWTGPRPSEVGGFLIGRVATPAPGEFIVHVEDFAPVECEHARGESWILSKSDKQEFARTLAKLARPRRDGRTVVGWFRTHSRRGIFLDQHDFEVFQEFFPEPSSVALLIRPDAEVVQAGFFFWEDGDIERTRTYLTFDFRPEAHAAAPVEAPVIEIRPTPNAIVRAPRTTVQPARLAPPRVVARLSGWRRKALLWTPVAAGLLAGFFWHPDPFAPAVMKSQAQRAGIEPALDRTVFTPVMPEPSEVAAAAVTATVQPSEKLHTRSRRATKPERKRLQAEVLLASKTTKPAPQLYPDAAPSVSTELRTDPLAQLVKAPELPHAVATVEPERASTLRRAVGVIPGLGFLKKKRQPQDFTPAKAVRQVQPASPVPLPNEVPVRVRLNVGKDGRVVHAELLGKRVDARLAESALSAARQWRFEPARVQEKAVDTEVVVQFRFVPSSESL